MIIALLKISSLEMSHTLNIVSLTTAKLFIRSGSEFQQDKGTNTPK